jgi:hypothetical protein
MKNFFLNLLDATNETSSKRFISLSSLFVFFVIIIYSVFFNKTVDSNIIYALVSLILGSSVMTLAQKNNSFSMNKLERERKINNNDEVIN